MKTGGLFGLLAIYVFSISAGAAESSTDAPLEFRAISKTAGPETRAITREAKNGPETIYIDREVILDVSSFKAAGAFYGVQGWTLTIELTEDGAKRFADYCVSHPGARTAVMVYGELVAAPMVGKSIPGGKIQIAPVSEIVAHDFAKQMFDLFHK